MQITTVGIDIAKNVFHVLGVNEVNKVLLKKVVKRKNLLNFLANISADSVVMEACSTSNYWGREISKLGFEVALIPPQYVKAFLTGNKNDYNDAYAIIIASQQCHIRTVAIKTVEQQDNRTLHQVRKLAIEQRRTLSNHIRGLLLEYGVVMGKGVSQVRKILVQSDLSVSEAMKQMLLPLRNQLTTLDNTIDTYEQMLKEQVKQNEVCQRLQEIPGFGPIVASSYFNEVGNGSAYRSGRDVSASLGLVPRQHSTGGVERLLGISKKGNKDLRCLLVQGAKAVVSRAKNKTDKLSIWINRLVEQRGHNKACVAYANKMARVAWAMTVSDSHYQVD